MPFFWTATALRECRALMQKTPFVFKLEIFKTCLFSTRLRLFAARDLRPESAVILPCKEFLQVFEVEENVYDEPHRVRINNILKK